MNHAEGLRIEKKFKLYFFIRNVMSLSLKIFKNNYMHLQLLQLLQVAAKLQRDEPGDFVGFKILSIL